MLPFSLIMFAVAALLLVMAALIYRGRTDLIHDYHQTKVKDKAAYGRAFGKALACVALPLIAAGIAGLFTDSVWVGLGLLACMVPAMIPLLLVQKKYNGGLF